MLLEPSVLRSDDCSAELPSTEEMGQVNRACLNDLIKISNEHVIICVNTER